MKIYIASKTAHAASWRKLRQQRSEISIVSTWIDEVGEGQTADYAELAERCLKEVAQADFILLYCATEEVLKGALIEVGAAMALGKEIRCVGDSFSLSRVFSRHPLWRWFPSVDNAINAK